MSDDEFLDWIDSCYISGKVSGEIVKEVTTRFRALFGNLEAVVKDCREADRKLGKAQGQIAHLDQCNTDFIRIHNAQREEIERLKAEIKKWKSAADSFAKRADSAELQYGEALKLISAMICYLGDNFLCDRNDSCKCIDHDARRFLAAAKIEKPKPPFLPCGCLIVQTAQGRMGDHRDGCIEKREGETCPRNVCPLCYHDVWSLEHRKCADERGLGKS